MRKVTSFFLTLLLTLCANHSAKAAVRFTAEGVDTEGLPGFTTYTVNGSATHAAIRGFTLTFEGAFNQVNPNGMATPFQDLNGQFQAIPVAQDTQFLFMSPSLSPPPLAPPKLPLRLPLRSSVWKLETLTT